MFFRGTLNEYTADTEYISGKIHGDHTYFLCRNLQGEELNKSGIFRFFRVDMFGTKQDLGCVTETNLDALKEISTTEEMKCKMSEKLIPYYEKYDQRIASFEYQAPLETEKKDVFVTKSGGVYEYYIKDKNMTFGLDPLGSADINSISGYSKGNDMHTPVHKKFLFTQDLKQLILEHYIAGTRPNENLTDIVPQWYIGSNKSKDSVSTINHLNTLLDEQKDKSESLYTILTENRMETKHLTDGNVMLRVKQLLNDRNSVIDNINKDNNKWYLFTKPDQAPNLRRLFFLSQTVTLLTEYIHNKDSVKKIKELDHSSIDSSNLAKLHKIITESINETVSKQVSRTQDTDHSNNEYKKDLLKDIESRRTPKQ